MSGGSMDYTYFKIKEYAEMLCDKELEELANDLASIYHDAEWWHSSDTAEGGYRESVSKFKEKWFKGDRTERLKGYIDEICAKTKCECFKLLGEELK